MFRSMTPRRMRLVCLGSLALNFALIGLIVGALITGPGRGGDRWHGAPLISALPDDLRGGLRDGGPPRDPDARRARFGALMDALRANPFDATALAALLQEQRAEGTARAERVEAGLIAALAQMSHAERAAYADRLADNLHRHAKRR